MTKIDELVGKLHNGEFRIRRPGTAIVGWRHANAVAANGGQDRLRTLSPKGKRQCAHMAPVMKNFRFDVILGSPLQRVPETIVETLGKETLSITTPVSELAIEIEAGTYDSGVMDLAYDMLGNAGLARIYELPRLARTMDRFAAMALNALHREFSKIPGWSEDSTDGNGKVIGLVSHGWLTPLILSYLIDCESARRHFLNHGVQECEAFTLALTFGAKPVFQHHPCKCD